jgi:MoxR-like ATPase
MEHATHHERILSQLTQSLRRVYQGSPQPIELLITAWLARGHVLIEDIPGVGKTTLARAFAAAIGGSFKRVQCTPDLMPADITGVSVYDERERQFIFHPGPVFADVLLADELNRTPPRTQAALLEALGEGTVTVDGEPRRLSTGFFGIATQNPLDHAGTYALPDSQRDRFLMCFRLGYPDADAEFAVLARDGAEAALAQVMPLIDATLAQQLRAAVQVVRLEESVRRYLLEVIRATRSAKGLLQGASTRAALGLQRAAQARALLSGRDFVIPDDIQALAVPCLAHRLTARAGTVCETAIQALLDTLPVPR